MPARVAFLALVTAVAGAADLPVRPAPPLPPPVPVLDWTGFSQVSLDDRCRARCALRAVHADARDG